MYPHIFKTQVQKICKFKKTQPVKLCEEKNNAFVLYYQTHHFIDESTQDMC